MYTLDFIAGRKVWFTFLPYNYFHLMIMADQAMGLVILCGPCGPV